jgi:hypothetical protein
VLAAWAARPDLLGVTSFVRSSFLAENTYRLILNFFHSNALNISTLTNLWLQFVLSSFSPVTESGYLVFVADGIKIGKEGKKMPAVKLLHQESENNTKNEFIMGHSFQALSLLVTAATGQVAAIPIVARICEGLLFKKSDRIKSQLDKLAAIFLDAARIAKRPAILVADSYYASKTIIVPLLKQGFHLISRVRWNTVGFEPAASPKIKKPGRPKKYGAKHRLREYFKSWRNAQKARSPIYGEEKIEIEFRFLDLFWKPAGTLVRFVLVKHPNRGKIILLSTDITLDPIAIIKLYGLRFKIEVSFKQAVNTIGTYLYHFWMKAMKPIKWGDGNQNVINRSTKYREAVTRKIDAYHRYVQIGCIVQGLLLHLAINYRDVVWSSFKGWLRTMRTDLIPSEMVVAYALRERLPEFLASDADDGALQKFILERAEPTRLPGLLLAG